MSNIVAQRIVNNNSFNFNMDGFRQISLYLVVCRNTQLTLIIQGPNKLADQQCIEQAKWW